MVIMFYLVTGMSVQDCNTIGRLEVNHRLQPLLFSYHQRLDIFTTEQRSTFPPVSLSISLKGLMSDRCISHKCYRSVGRVASICMAPSYTCVLDGLHSGVRAPTLGGRSDETGGSCSTRSGF